MKGKVLVIGAARSGLAAAKFLAEHDYEVVLTDSHRVADQALSEQTSIQCIWGEPPDVQLLQPLMIVISPGVPLTIAPIVAAQALNIPVLGETELAYRYTQASIIAITGTNGKTTTTTLIGELLKSTGRRVIVGGNIGLPLISVAEELGEQDLIVAEMSSFQLETTMSFRPKIALMLNLTPDHLDRHGDMTGYLVAKIKIFANQENTDYLVLNADEPYFDGLAEQARSKVIFFSQKNILTEGIYLQGDEIVAALGGASCVICKRKDLAIKGNHNLENAMGAISVALLMGLKPELIKAVLLNFSGVEHRLELVRIRQGVQYINDSKGTNPASTIKALQAYEQPLILIAGGKNKGSDFTELAKQIAARSKAVVLIGQAKEELRQALERISYKTYIVVENYDQAVAKAAELAEAGDIVLLSPACASWDMFKDYEERGRLFKQLVNELS